MSLYADSDMSGAADDKFLYSELKSVSIASWWCMHVSVSEDSPSLFASVYICSGSYMLFSSSKPICAVMYWAFSNTGL